MSPSLTAKDTNASLAALSIETDQAKNNPDLAVHADVPYGDRPRQLLDFYTSKSQSDAPMPCLIFIHGGFWQEGSKDLSGFAAQTFVDHGWSYVSVGYTLTPDVSLSELTQEISEALSFVHANAEQYHIDPDHIVLSGHSAGGHLTASTLAGLVDKSTAQKIAGAALISGVFELAPIAKSYVNDKARITEAEISELSPLRHVPLKDVPVHVVIGADEPEAFQIQSTVMTETWGDALSDLTVCSEPGRDHFDILQVLADPDSKTFQTILQMSKRS